MSFTPVLLSAHVGLQFAPADVLECLGIVVIRTWMGDTWAVWSRDRRKIVLASGLSPIQERCVLAHELEHVLAGDADCGGGPLAVRQERRADFGAARKLIAISDLAPIAQWAPDRSTAAKELRVTERMLNIRLMDLKGEGWPWRGGSKIAG